MTSNTPGSTCVITMYCIGTIHKVVLCAMKSDSEVVLVNTITIQREEIFDKGFHSKCVTCIIVVVCILAGMT